MSPAMTKCKNSVCLADYKNYSYCTKSKPLVERASFLLRGRAVYTSRDTYDICSTNLL